MQPVPTTRRTKPPVWLIVLAAGGSLLSLMTVLAFSLWGLIFPPGEPVAVLDLRSGAAETPVDLAAGDEIIIRADVASRGSSLKSDLRRTTLRVGLRPPSGPERLSSCAMYDGGAKTSSSGFSGSRLTGATNDCKLRAEAAGRHVVRAQIAWGSLSPTEARLELRRVAAKLERGALAGGPSPRTAPA
jgi:hypothetical protein